MDDSKGDAQDYLRNALHQALHTTGAFLSSIWELITTHSHASIALRAAPDGSFILSHAKKDTSSQHTNFVISTANPTAYDMLATQNDSIKTYLNTTTTSKGQTKQPITFINIIAHTRSVLGRTYWQLLANPDITQLNATATPLRYNQTKELTGRPSDKIALATRLLTHTNVLTT
jgi:hypothetical protein